LAAGVRDALVQLDSRNVAGEARTPNVGGMLPTNFIGGPDAVVEQIERCREAGAGVVDLMFQTPGAKDIGLLMASLELFGKQVLPRIREV
jgi:alkanesulfonate monooxygenase SsuD/methylene tetrahydromethanopterin reductase-like flavin-dependent oxidoreductase (luciferase family)